MAFLCIGRTNREAFAAGQKGDVQDRSFLFKQLSHGKPFIGCGIICSIAFFSTRLEGL